MAYFNHAFHKAFLATTVDTDTTDKTQDLVSAEFAVVDGETYGVLDAAGITGFSGKHLMLAQGSLHTADTIGNNPGHGGYLESSKSKGINPAYVTKIWHTCCNDLSPAVLVIESCDGCFPCGDNPMFRLDVKGSPALRFLNHNAYSNVDTGNYCCAEGQEYLDPAWVLGTIAQNLVHDPIVTPFIQITAEYSTDGGVTYLPLDLDTYTPSADPTGDTICGKITITGAYVDTRFGDCSFRTTDFYNKEPVSLTGMFVDESGDACYEDCATYTYTPGLMANTQGETVIRDILLTEQYMQNPYNQGNADSARIREIEGSDDIKAAVARASLYDRWYILHNVPRFNNPTGVFDNDQYLYSISSLCDSAAAAQVAVAMNAISALTGIAVEEDCPVTS